ncbi:hypothetical protein AB0M54_26910 [Actinoplanes sp. NPDC051470]|uniref:hypothetical protein n=1 Tax=Actinoplanes sp. NPDC051470 TaxID=3157224 RepID=UPI0034162700
MVTPQHNERPQVSQTNSGPGTFVGRDNYAPINLIDDATRAVLSKLSKEAPPLAELLKRAINDGLVSPDVVYSLEFAARSINEDVAHALYTAGQNINEDVANTLAYAGRSFEGALENVDRFEKSVSSAGDTANRLEDLSRSLDSLISSYERDAFIGRLENVVESIDLHADRMQGVVQLPPAQVVVAWKPTLYAFLIGLIVGMTFIAYVLATKAPA